MRTNDGPQNLPGCSKKFATTNLCALRDPQHGQLSFNYIVAGAGGVGQGRCVPHNRVHITTGCIAHFIWATLRYASAVISKFMLTNRRDAGYAHGSSRLKDQISNPRGFQVSNSTYTPKMHRRKLHRYIPYGELSEVCTQVLRDCR
jgi:hypothetical protein